MAGSSEKWSASPYLRRFPPVKIILGEAASKGRVGMVPGGGVSAALDLGEVARAVVKCGRGLRGGGEMN